MPLARVVDYLNANHDLFHPRTRLGERSSYRFEQGRLTANIGTLRLRSYQVPIVDVGRGAVVAHRARLRVTHPSGREQHPESLYLHAWDGSEVIFLDRFLRTLHALEHLNRPYSAGDPLVVDVHARHVAAVPGDHGAAFEGLLAQLGLAREQIVLRLHGPHLLRDEHSQRAAISFAARGYRLLAAELPPQATDWERLRTLGVGWASPAADAVAETLRPWLAAARDHGIATLLEADAPGSTSERARRLGFALAEAEQLDSRRAAWGR